jgi:hypothetical protein
MQIILKNPGQAISDFSVSGSVVTVSGVETDCAARQKDTAVTIEIRKSANGAREGGKGAYLAQISIPPRQYAAQETPLPGEDGEMPVGEVREPLPLDPNEVVVTLWPLAG